jgi:AsmA family/AsmA-like C-terminal region
VQTTLLGLAIALILALVTALVAPFVVDWNRYRSTFEEQASRLTGVTVHVNGTIDARILPSPHINLHDVEIGEEARAPRLRAVAVELEVGLGPLLRGEVQATDVRVVAPRINLGLDGSGAVDWPVLSPAFSPDALTISRLNVEDGRITLDDAASGSRLVLQNLSFNGDIRSFLGPFKGEGVFHVGDEPYRYRISGNHIDDDGGIKIRLGVNPSNHPLTTEIEGILTFERGVPQFEGTLSLTRPVGVTLAGGERVMNTPWQLAGKLRATPPAASLNDVAFLYGPEERAVNFSGKAELKFGAQPHIDGEITARQVDLDRMLADPDVTHQPPLVLFRGFVEAFIEAVKPPLPIAASVAVDAATVGGTTIQSLRGHVRSDDTGWSLDDFAFRAPGLTDVSLSGRFGAGQQGLTFGGPASVESADLKMLLAWLEGRGDQPSGSPERLNARGQVTIANDRFVLDHLSASLDQENVEGRLSYVWAEGKRPAALDGELHAARLNFDALSTFATAAASDGAFEIPRDVALVLDVGRATFAGVDARAINARVKFDAGILHIDRLSIGDLGGAALDVNGRIDELSSWPRGQLTLDVDATTLGGLTNIAARFAPRIADSLRPFIDRLAPAKMHGVLTVDRATAAGTVTKLDLGGNLGALRLALNGEATGALAQADAAVVRVRSRLDADDGGALVRLLTLDRVLAVDQLPGQMTITVSGPLNGDVRVSCVASAGGFAAAAEGGLHLSGDSAPIGSLRAKASAADLRPLRHALTGQPGAAVATSASAIIGIAGADLTLTDLIVTVGKSPLRGRLDLKLASPIVIGGDVAAEDVDAAAAAALLLGLPSAVPNAAKPWSPAPVGPGAFGAVNGAVTFKFDRAALTPALVARDFKGIVQFQSPEIALRDLDARLAGGHLTGGLTFRHDPQAFAAHGYVELAGANAAAIIASNSNAIDGVLSAKLQGESQGLSPEAIVGAFHGGGTVALTGSRFAGINPAVFDAAMRLADHGGTIDAPKIRIAVSAAMDNGRLVVPKAEAEVTIAAGQMRLSNAKLQAQSGAELLLDGVLDLNNAAVDARVTLSGQPAGNALIPTRPELAVAVKGPLTAPERKLDMSSLIGWLTLRATEQQTRRLESLEANRRPDVLGDAIRPPLPSVRIIPQGTPLEINNHANAAAAPAFGTNAFDRLRSEVPAAATAAPPASPATKPAISIAAPGAEKTTATTGTAQPAPLPGLRSLLNSLFHSQN